MSSRLLRRRSATAAWIYAAVAFGILGTIVAARVLGLREYGVFATALVSAGFFQSLLDLTVEESLTQYGFR
jgi:O-antigen/teichoic acid export membrane protein